MAFTCCTCISNMLREFVRKIRRFFGDTWPGERCWSWRCIGKRIVAGYVVSDHAWSLVVGDPNTTRCLSCFDRTAQFRNVEYEVEEVYPISWGTWRKDD